MKLFYLDSGRMPTEKAHGYQIMKMCEAFAEAGHDVTLGISSRKNEIKTDPFEYYDVKPVFRIKRIWSIDAVNILPKYGSWISRFSFLLAGKSYLFFQGYDCLYTRELMSGLVFRDFVLEVHDLPENARSTDLRMWQKARRVIVITRALKAGLVGLGIAEQKILVAADGVDLEKFKVQSEKLKVREELGLPQDKKLVMYTGHLYEWKGVGVLLEAAKKFQISNFKFQTQFIFVGGTDDDIKRFKKQAEGLDNVLILGHKPHSIIPKYLAAADVLVLPNSAKIAISKYYSSPLKLFEYMAAGKPIVASDIPSIREVLSEDSAVLVAPDDAAALAEGIRRVFGDPALAGRIADRAQTEAGRYSWTARAQNILDFLV